MKAVFIFLSCLIMLEPVQSVAQTFTDKGTSELGGTFAVTFTGASGRNQTLGFNSLIINPYFGGMLAKGLEIGFAPSIVSDGHAFVGLYLAPAYNFDIGGKIYPFLEAVIGFEIVSSGTTGDGTAYGFNFGTKSNLSGNFLLIMQLSYLHEQYSTVSDPSYTPTVNSMALNVGFSVFFPRKTPSKTK